MDDTNSKHVAKGNIKVHKAAGYLNLPTEKWQTEAAATAILAGEPVKLKAAGSPYVIPVADAEPIIGTTTAIIGIAASDSTQTASADGSVTVYPAELPGVIYKAKAKTASTVDTLAELNALVGDNVVLDLTTGVYTVDAAAGDGNTKGIRIVGGNFETQEVYFKIRPAAAEGAIA